MPKKITPEIAEKLKTIYDFCYEEDRGTRERQVRQWRQLKLIWEGFSRIWYSEVAHDWRVFDQESDAEDTNQAYYDKPINVFRAYLESIIAALSVTVPPIKCYPDDADSPLDLITAKAGDKIAQLVYRHNDVGILWLHALFIFVTEGMVAYKTYPREDKEYGTYKKKIYEDVEEDHQITACPLCGYQMDDKTLAEGEILAKQELNEFMPDDEDAALHNEIMQGTELCPACMQMMDPQITKQKFIVTRLTENLDEPKTRICMEAYGGSCIKIPNYSRKQKDIPYLIFSEEKSYVMVLNEYEHLKANETLIEQLKRGPNSPSGYEQYDQWGRLNPQYMGEYPQNVVTVNKCWLRPAAYNFLGADEKGIKLLQKHFPDGAMVCVVNDEFADAYNDSLDDNWTLTENPMADYLHFAPLGATLTSVQEITNDLISLTLQTIEHGIGQIFADPAVLDFTAYSQTEVIPGGVYPATPKSGKALSDGFKELKTASLSSEVMPFGQSIQSMAQMASGALPSLFGGQLEGAETASQYSMSRAQALQRLQNIWKLQTTTWKRAFGKVIPMYVREVDYDESDVERNKEGNFVNTFIRKSELEGRMGRIELEANENLPMTWAQKKDLLMTLLQATNPEIMKLLNAPENSALIHDALGLVDWYMPGEDDIIKQYDEIKELLNTPPIVTGDMMTPEMSSVPVDPDFDNHQVEFEIVRKWAISEAGRQTKLDNPDGYKNVLLHGKEHLMIMQQAAQAAAESQAMLGEGATPNEKPNPKSKEAPITGEQDVQTMA